MLEHSQSYLLILRSFDISFMYHLSLQKAVGGVSTRSNDYDLQSFSSIDPFEGFQANNALRFQYAWQLAANVAKVLSSRLASFHACKLIRT